jgi:hypothetical protein
MTGRLLRSSAGAIVFIYDLFNDAVNGTVYVAVNDSGPVISEWERMWKEPAVVCQSSQHLQEGGRER